MTGALNRVDKIGCQIYPREIGVFDFMGSVDITDPCYDKGVHCRLTDVSISCGAFSCVVWERKSRRRENVKYTCAAGIYLDGKIPPQETFHFAEWISADTATIGFYHKKPDFSRDEWKRFCERFGTLGEMIDELGFSVDFGSDGDYKVLTAKEQGEIAAVEVYFG